MGESRTIRLKASTHVVSEGAGFLVRRPAAMGQLMSPFLLLDEMGPAVYGPGEAVGAPWHPHRGFETVTYLLDGEFEHQDSAGHKGTLQPGDVQWMTAGRGVIHSEEPSKKIIDEGGRVHGFQIWVNLPAEHKMMSPRYQDIASEESPIVEKDGVWARVIAGEIMGTKSSIDTVIPISMIHVRMEKGSSLNKKLDDGLNCMLYMMKGEVQMSNEIGKEHQLLLLSSDGDVDLTANEDSEFLILAGPEINEPIARYGPFVMNTREEIIRAIEDYNNGTFLDHDFVMPV